MSTYFRDIWLAITTILIGMKVTFKHLFVRAITVQYPRQKMTMYPVTRARLVNHEHECSVCLACMRSCPAKCFAIKGIRADKDEDLGMLPDGKPKRMYLIQFDIEMITCLFCGLCVDACPTKSLRWEAPQEESVYTRGEMLKDFVTMPDERKQELLKKDADRKAARAAAAAEKGAKPALKKVEPKEGEDGEGK